MALLLPRSGGRCLTSETLTGFAVFQLPLLNCFTVLASPLSVFLAVLSSYLLPFGASLEALSRFTFALLPGGLPYKGAVCSEALCPSFSAPECDPSIFFRLMFQLLSYFVLTMYLLYHDSLLFVNTQLANITLYTPL